MKKTNKSALYSTIKSTITKLGISAEDTVGIISYIKFMESNVPISSNVIKDTSKGKDNLADKLILSILNESPDKPYSMQDIVNESGLTYSRVQTLIKNLKTSKKVKIVDYITGSRGPSKVLYQTWRSPLKALKFVTENQGYSTVNGFIKSNKKLLVKGIGVINFTSAVEKAELTSYPLSLSIGIAKGYKNSDLKKVALGNTEEKPKRKYTKRIKGSKPKRKYTRRTKVQSVEIQANQEVKNKQLNLFSFFRKKKGNSSDLIKF